MGDGVRGMTRDRGFETGEVGGHGLGFGARTDRDRFGKIERESAPGGVCAGDEDDRAPRQDGKVGPGRQERPGLPEQTAGPGVPTGSRGCRR